MKLILLSGLLFILLTVSPNSLYAQNDSILQQEEKQYIEPEALPADLGMITPPVGFEKTDKFNGFIHFKTGSAIIMTLIKDATYLTIAKGMTEEFYQENLPSEVLDLLSEDDLRELSGAALEDTKG